MIFDLSMAGPCSHVFLSINNRKS